MVLVDRDLSRLERHFHYLYQPLKELRASDDPDALLWEWRWAEKPSQGWRNAQFYDHVVDVVAEALCVPRDEAEELVREYVAQTR